MTSADASVLHEIVRTGMLAWGREPSVGEVEESAKRLNEEVSTLDPKEKGIFVARKSGAIVGFARVARDRHQPSEWWLLGLCVHPDQQRQGIGKALVRACIAYAQERGATLIRSETHLENTASIRFHESVGFENEGKFTASDGDEKIAFRLTTAPTDQ